MVRMLTFLAITALILQCTACYAQVEVDARKIADAGKDTVVTVDVVVDAKMTYNGQTDKMEQKRTTTATIIDPSGLAVTSLVQVSPDSYMDSSQKDGGYSYSFETKDVRIKTSDGSEIPSDIVLRDRDLDLAFIRPKAKPDKPLPYLDLTKSSNPQILDQVVVLSRLGQAANRAAAARLDRVQAVVTKPRTFYVINGGLHDELGVTTFTLDGKCAGLLVIRYNGTTHTDDNSDAYIVVLPCATVLNAAQQAREAKAPAKTSATTKK